VIGGGGSAHAALACPKGDVHIILWKNHYVNHTNEDNIIFIPVHSIARVSPSLVDEMELLTYGGKRHHHYNMNGV
jgi:hypothetical protein